MKKKKRAFIKTFHVLSASLWLGASASIVLMQSLGGWSTDVHELAAMNRGFTYLDIGLIIPGAVGSLLTGFLLCKTTGWGFIRYRWVITKWAATLIGILAGSALLGPWQLQMLRLTAQTDVNLLSETYQTVRLSFTLLGAVQLILLLMVVTISISKPWGKAPARKPDFQSKEGMEESIA